MQQVDVQNAQLTILINIDGQMYLTGFDKEQYEAVQVLIKTAIKTVIPTEVKQVQLNGFLGVNL
ncbi:hypothetical protein R6U77_00845 [Lysinibacillus louembei]|uniref:Cell division protein FtsQ n=1 Tax=Lysinibacillus louembei TaxID=1470088 RepID=A0ABZ0RYA0_9BACI|nr:hypothetical protein [Lysinibacillus louembei]WPK12266.1 hypothetical protein R6U77_00845 [Lysinibacillus louembei]